MNELYVTCSVQGHISVVFVMKATHSEFMCRWITGWKWIITLQFVSHIRACGGVSTERVHGFYLLFNPAIPSFSPATFFCLFSLYSTIALLTPGNISTPCYWPILFFIKPFKRKLFSAKNNSALPSKGSFGIPSASNLICDVINRLGKTITCYIWPHLTET